MDTNKIILIDNEGNEGEFYIEELTRVYGGYEQNHTDR